MGLCKAELDTRWLCNSIVHMQQHDTCMFIRQLCSCTLTSHTVHAQHNVHADSINQAASAATAASLSVSVTSVPSNFLILGNRFTTSIRLCSFVSPS